VDRGLADLVTILSVLLPVRPDVVDILDARSYWRGLEKAYRAFLCHLLTLDPDFGISGHSNIDVDDVVSGWRGEGDWSRS
jgi:hypothetical protein